MAGAYRSALLTVLLSACALAAAAAAHAESRAIGDTRIFASVPKPGQPAGIAVDGDRVLVSTLGLLTQPTACPRLFAFDLRGGALAAAHPIERAMEPASVMALHGVAVDADGRAYVVDMNGRIMRVDLATGEQDVYASFPPALAGLATMPVDIAFAKNGDAYVSDQNLAGVWRVPAGGGEPQLWFQDPRLFGYLFGPTGVRIDPSGKFLYLSVAISQQPATLRQGLVYRLPLADPSPARLEQVFAYPAQAVPFGIAFGASGRLYVALAGPGQVSILAPEGRGGLSEERRFPSAADNAPRKVPYDRPLGIAFDGSGSLLVTNSNALSPPNSDRWVVFEVFVDDTAAPLARPAIRPRIRGRQPRAARYRAQGVGALAGHNPLRAGRPVAPGHGRHGRPGRAARQQPGHARRHRHPRRLVAAAWQLPERGRLQDGKPRRYGPGRACRSGL